MINLTDTADRPDLKMKMEARPDRPGFFIEGAVRSTGPRGREAEQRG